MLICIKDSHWYFEVLTTAARFSFFWLVSQTGAFLSGITFFDYPFGSNLWKEKLTLIFDLLHPDPFPSEPQITRDVSLGISHPK